MLKECIKELLDEGSFNSALKEVMMESIQPRSQGSTSQHVSFLDVLNSSKVNHNIEDDETGIPQYLSEGPSRIIYEQSHLARKNQNVQQEQQVPDRLSNIIRATALQTAGDPKRTNLMESIFADTAMTTLMTQRDDPESRGMNGLLPKETAATQAQLKEELQTIEALAPDGDISRWAKVAKMSQRSKKI